MWNYYSYYPYGIKSTFSLAGRVNEILAQQNVHGHRNNYSTHKGFGTGQPTKDSYQDRAIKAGQAVTQLPNAAHHASPYVETVWAPPGAEAGVRRLIINANNLDEIYFTDDHYTVYWKIWGAESVRVVLA